MPKPQYVSSTLSVGRMYVFLCILVQNIFFFFLHFGPEYLVRLFAFLLSYQPSDGSYLSINNFVNGVKGTFIEMWESYLIKQ